jgi:DNA polymerase (family 10)/putative hydrolase
MVSPSIFKQIFSGSYLFHLHTRYTDGNLYPVEYFEFAQQHGYQRLIFLEHIRRSPNYDISQYVSEIRECESRFLVPATIGFEAKVLPGGELDISDEHLKLAQVVGIAEHGFKGTLAELCNSLRLVFCRSKELPCVWVHPGLGLRRKAELEKQPFTYAGLLEEASALGILIECNRRYGLIQEEYISRFVGNIVWGLDAHSQSDLSSQLVSCAREGT